MAETVGQAPEVTEAATVGLGAQRIICDPSGAPFTLRLPPASAFPARAIHIVNVTEGSNLVTLEVEGEGDIRGPRLSPNRLQVIGKNAKYSAMSLVAVGYNWIVH